MKAIHLIQKLPSLRPWRKQEGSPEYQSGYWNLSAERASNAIGAKIYFHEQQVAPSFFGGTITAFEIKPDEPWKGRIIFTFEPSSDLEGIKTERGGWSMEKKIVE